MPFPPKPDPEKNCEACGKPLARKRFASGRLEDRTVFLKRRHCSQSCANSRKVVTRSAHQWRAKPHRKSACEECGTTKRLHVHHKDKNWRNDDPSNLQTLCATCHLKLHWREDREQRVAAIKAAASGGRTQPQSTAGKSSSGA